MADIRISTPNQYEYTGSGPLDYKLHPISNKSDISRISRDQRWKGMTLYVISEGREFWFKDGTRDTDFVPKNRILDGGEY